MRQKSWYTKELGELVASNAKGDKEHGYMVISSLYGWRVLRTSGKRAIRVFDSHKEAVAFAKKYARKKDADSLSIHDKTGMVKEFIYFKKQAKN